MTNGATCDNCLDFIGNTESARQNYRHEDAGYMLWEKDGGLTPEKVALIENAPKIRKLWWLSVTSAPLEFIEMKSIKAYWLYFGKSPTATTATPMTTNWAGVVSEVNRTEAACSCQVGPLREQAAQLATNVRFPALEETPLLGLAICFTLIASSFAFPPPICYSDTIARLHFHSLLRRLPFEYATCGISLLLPIMDDDAFSCSNIFSVHHFNNHDTSKTPTCAYTDN